jgi:hypothetical protein
MANLTVPGALFDQGNAGQELMPQYAIMDTAGEIPLKKGGILVMNNGTAATAFTLADDITVGSFFILFCADTTGAGHTITTPSTITWDGTNDVATFDADGEFLMVFMESATRLRVVYNPNSVAFS